MLPALRIFIVLWSLGGICGSTPASVSNAQSAAPNPPRYKLVPGLELNYRSSWSIKHWKDVRSSRRDENLDVTVWVVRANADGSCRLIIYQSDTSTMTSAGKKRQQKPWKEVSYADVFPDGRIVPSPAIELGTIPAVLFPPLPRDASELSRGWVASEQLFRFSCHQESLNSNFVFNVTLETPFNKTYLEKHNARYTLDVSRGLLVRSEESVRRDSDIHEDAAGTTELLSDKTIEPRKLRELTADADRYFAAVQNYDRRLGVAAKAPPDDAARIADEAGRKLKPALDGLKLEVFKAVAADLLRQHDVRARNIVEKARANLIGKPAPEFETTDIGGNRVRLADLRGKVVVLDFWYRNCAWCVAAMPQINQLAADFAGRPVVILGMNTDRDPADARFVIEKMGLKYPTLKAEALQEKFGVDEFPTLMVIDQQGVVRDVHTGYSAKLSKEVGDVIRGLLARK